MFVKDVDKDGLILLGARASRVENQDAIDTCIVGMLGDPKEVTCLVYKPMQSFRIWKPELTTLLYFVDAGQGRYN